MADVNYINPTAILPQQGWKPQGFMGGMQYAQQMKDYQDVMSLSQLMSQMGAQKEMEDMTLGAPVRAAKRLSDIATSTANTQTAVPMAQANLGLRQDEAQVSRAGVPNKIVIEATKHYTQMGAEGLAQLNQQIQAAQIISGIMGQNGAGTGTAMVQQLLPQLRVNPEFAQAVMQDPAKVTQFLNTISPAVQAELTKQREKSDADYRQAIDVEADRGMNSANVARIMNQGRLDVAGAKPAGAPTTDRLIAMYTEQIRALQAAGQPIPAELTQGLAFLQQQKIAERSAGVQQQQAGGERFGLGGVPPVAAPVHPAAQPNAAPMDMSKLSPVQKDWIARAKASNPNMTDAQIIEEGKKRGKL